MVKVSYVYVGVDISKKYLDVHLNPVGQTLRVTNCQTGCNELLHFLTNHNVKQVVCESTGGYERLICKTLTEAGHKVWQVEPKRIKAFIYSEGVKAKTDKIDAKMIALFASKKSCSYESIQPSHNNEKLKSFVALKSSITTTAAIVKTRLQQTYDPDCIKILTNQLNFLEQQISTLESKIKILIKSDAKLHEQAAIIASIPGIGDGTTAITLAMLPELGKIKNKHASALVGVAPYIQQSGAQKGYATISGGRHSIRAILYMAALSAIKHNQKLINFYTRLRDSGKSFKVAIVAVMRKLVIYMNTLVTKGELWNPSI